MTEIPAEPILDYASPSSRTPLRLATQSVISILSSANGVTVTESLDGHFSALAAILFTSATVTLLGFTTLASIHPRNFSDVLDAWFILVPYFVCALGTLGLILAVIHTNWRRTILSVSSKQLVFVFHSVIKEKVLEWPSENVRHVCVVQELVERNRKIVYSLRIEIGDRQVAQLFGGHEIDELGEIARLIREKLAAQE